MKEEWRDIKGYEGKYQVSNLGRVKSLKDNHGNYREKILDIKPNKKGYLRIELSLYGKKKKFQVHRLVAQSFIPNPNNLPEVNHKDENKQNNCVYNLEWCTHQYNSNYGTRILRASNTHKGKKHLSNSYSNNYCSRKVMCVTTDRDFNCIKEASEYYNIDHTNISACCKGKRKSAGKHPVTGEKLVWKYLDDK